MSHPVLWSFQTDSRAPSRARELLGTHLVREHPQLAAQTYVKTYGVTLTVAQAAVKSSPLLRTTSRPARLSGSTFPAR